MAKNGGTVWSRGPGPWILVLLAILGLPTVAGFALLHTITHPRRAPAALDPAEMLLRAEEVEFPAADGVSLSGWIIRGRRDWPFILLCHDLGSSRSSLLNFAVALNRTGYPLLLLDFRGHGNSGGQGSTLGIDERLDVLGAIRYLRRGPASGAERFGAWGIGMGAYAAALAALEEEAIAALALDSSYPDVAVELDRLARDRLPPALGPLVSPLRVLYNPYMRFGLRAHSLAASIGDLADRDILFIAAAEPPERFSEQRSLYAALPESPGGRKDFLALGASALTGLYAEDRKRYDEAIVRFFSAHLPPAAGARGDARRPAEVMGR
ncbi:MAG: alpha/beta hydrolase [Acidobacteriota bacterium]